MKTEDWRRRRRRHLLLLGLVLVACLRPAAAAAGVPAKNTDVAALLAVKLQLQDLRDALHTWSLANAAALCADWVGVACNGDGRVSALHLPSKRLGGRIAKEVGALSELRQLSLHTNMLSGPIPQSVGSLRNLRGLYLFRNRLSGAIPATLPPALQTLDLGGNTLSGSIPATLPPSLRRLRLNHNNLSASVPASVSALSRLQELLLRSNRLSGFLPPELSLLPALLTLDLSHNSLAGAFPASSSTIHAFPSLLLLDVSSNNLSGSLPPNFVSPHLLFLNLSHNHFTGHIPTQLGDTSHLSSLDLSHNNFTGALPFSLAKLANLTTFSCSFNGLRGPVPKMAHTFNATSFEGSSNELCGFDPAFACEPQAGGIAHQIARSHKGVGGGGKAAGVSALSVVFLIAGAVMLVFMVVCVWSLVVVCWCRRAKGGGKRASAKEEVGPLGKLVQFEGWVGVPAEGLLRATAEVVGKSTYGTVYKATLEDGRQVAVKRLREGIVRPQHEFDAEVRVLGRVRHPNLLPLRAYYWGPKDEKLLIFDFMHAGSLALFLHARGPAAPLTWQARMRIAVGAARGLAHLHGGGREDGIVHGNLTASNVLLDAHMEPRLSDYALSRLMTAPANAAVVATAGSLGYRAPELTKLTRATTKSDVYSFGIVLLELLTGKAPSNHRHVGSPPSTSAPPPPGHLDFPRWVAASFDTPRPDVFDLELMKAKAPDDGDLILTLRLAMACVKLPPSERPHIREVVLQLERIKI